MLSGSVEAESYFGRELCFYTRNVGCCHNINHYYGQKQTHPAVMTKLGLGSFLFLHCPLSVSCLLEAHINSLLSEEAVSGLSLILVKHIFLTGSYDVTQAGLSLPSLLPQLPE